MDFKAIRIADNLGEILNLEPVIGIKKVKRIETGEQRFMIEFADINGQSCYCGVSDWLVCRDPEVGDWIAVDEEELPLILKTADTVYLHFNT